MAKNAYIGVGGVARKIKKGYVGVDTEVPIIESRTTTYDFTFANLERFFTVTNGTSYTWNQSAGTSGIKLVPANIGVNSSTATLTLTAKADLTNVVIRGAYYTESSYDKVTLKVNGSTVLNAVSGSSSDSQRWTGNLPKDKTIEFTYTKDGSQSASGEANTAFNVVGDSVSITEDVIIGYETKEIAHKIKKAYVGVGGVARPCWSGRELAYYGTITPLSFARYWLAATTVGNYALFGGGRSENSSLNIIDVYDASLTRTWRDVLNARHGLVATTVGNYALFGGGYGSDFSNIVDAYDTSLTRTTKLLSKARTYFDATTVGNYALFGGGYGETSSVGYFNDVDAYDTSLVRTTPTALSKARGYLGATTVGNYALFGGGYDGTSSVGYFNDVDAYDTSLTRTTPTPLSQARYYFAATTVGNYALFGGGYGSDFSNIVDAYDTSLTRTTPTELSAARYELAATTVGDYALFGGGSYSSIQYNAVDAYDASLVRTTPTALSQARYDLAATTIGNYALFGGGDVSGNGSSGVSTVDVYTVA